MICISNRNQSVPLVKFSNHNFHSSRYLTFSDFFSKMYKKKHCFLKKFYTKYFCKCAIDLSYTFIDHLRAIVMHIGVFHFVPVSQEWSMEYILLTSPLIKWEISLRDSCKSHVSHVIYFNKKW